MKNEEENIRKTVNIFTLNSRDNIIMSSINETYPNMNIQSEILSYFEILKENLKNKGIDYYKLKTALIPTDEKLEIAFVFNSKYFEDITMFYGEEIFNEFLSVLNKESCQSILAGDYVKMKYFKPEQLETKFIKNIQYVNKCEYENNMDYFIIYINNLTNRQKDDMIKALSKLEYFVGYFDLTYSSDIKLYLSLILSPICLKYRNVVILPTTILDSKENYNERGYKFEKYGFSYISIYEMLYDLFLAYKIENDIIDEEDLKFGYSILYSKVPEYENIEIIIEEKKLKYLKENKSGIFKLLDWLSVDKSYLEKYILINFYNKYIYNIRINEYGNYLFDVLIEVHSQDKKRVRKTTIGLEYIPKENKLKLLTIC